jgi:hypothetical protein
MGRGSGHPAGPIVLLQNAHTKAIFNNLALPFGYVCYLPMVMLFLTNSLECWALSGLQRTALGRITQR